MIWKGYKVVTCFLSIIYRYIIVVYALQALDGFSQKGNDKYPEISKLCLVNWTNLNTFIAYPMNICKAIPSPNPIELMDSIIRHPIKKSKVFPADNSVKKVVDLAIMAVSRQWTMPIQNWKAAMNRFSMFFKARVVDYV